MILIIGGNGFIGRHVRAALTRTHEVWSVRREAGADWISFPGQETQLSGEAFSGPEGDAAIRRAEAVVYLSTRSVPGTFEADPASELGENVAPAFRLFDRVATLNPECRIVFTSSGGTIYGRDHSVPIKESSPTLPISAYGYGKLASEQALTFLTRTRGVRATILRLSNPVGLYHQNPRQGLVPAALNAVRTGTPLRLFGNTNIRDYIAADDVADAVRLAAMDDRRTSTILNIGSGVGSSIADVLEIVAEVTGQPVPYTLEAPRSLDVPYVVLDCALAKSQLGWETTRSLRDAVATVWFND